MSVKASVKNLPIPPRKARLITDLVRGKSVESASSILKLSSKKGAGQVLKLVKSAAANAVNNFELDKNNLYIKGIQAQEGLVLKRWIPRAHGRATPILKRRTHILIELDEIKKTKKEQKGKKSKMRTVSYEELKKSGELKKQVFSQCLIKQ